MGEEMAFGYGVIGGLKSFSGVIPGISAHRCLMAALRMNRLGGLMEERQEINIFIVAQTELVEGGGELSENSSVNAIAVSNSSHEVMSFLWSDSRKNATLGTCLKTLKLSTANPSFRSEAACIGSVSKCLTCRQSV